MPEIYADWKSLEPLTVRVPAGTKCVVVGRDEQDRFVLGEVVTVEDSDSCPYCSNTDGVCEVMRVIELALLPDDYQALSMHTLSYENTFILTRVNKSDSKLCTLCSAKLFTGDEVVVELDTYSTKSLICTKCADADEDLCRVVVDERKNFELED